MCSSDLLFKLFSEGKITQEEAMLNADSATNMLWLINQATAGQISGGAPSAPAGAGAAPADKGKPAAGADTTFNDFKIDMNA